MRRSRALKQPPAALSDSRPAVLLPSRALALPLAFTLLLVAIGLLPSVRRDAHLFWSFWGAGAALGAWNASLLATALGRRRTLTIEVVLRPQHYLQACAHVSILLYWGWYWRPVYDAAPLIAGQLAFAYAFDALFAWSRRNTYALGFGPIPIVFSTNLFLWFKPDWFYLQFLMVAVGFAAKDLIRWNKDGRPAHIFNPSSFTLMLFSLALIATARTGTTWGPEIATTQLNPPHIYLWIFLVTLPAQFLFGVAPMTWAAVTTTYVFGVAYFAATGTHFFPERPIPIAVFLGMHLLFTDPSTSPRTELGRLIFGVLYGLSVVGLLALLTFLELPTFYDKLLPVPVLNLLIRRIDRAARSDWLKRFDPAAIGRHLMPRRRNLAYMSIWTVTFLAMQLLTGAQATLVRADSLLNQGRIDEAIEQYRAFVAADPTDAEGHNNLGVALMQAGRLDEAAAAFERATTLRPESPNTLKNLGLALIRTGRFPAAVAPLQRAIALQPDNPETRGSLGQALLETGRVDEAVGSFQRAVQLRPDSADAHDALGDGLMRAGRFADAAASFQRAIDLQPDDPATLNNLGVALMQAGRFADAVSPFRRVIALRPNSPESHQNLGAALVQAGRLDEGVASFQRAVDLKPDDVQARVNLAEAYAAAGRSVDAKNAAEAAEALRAGTAPRATVPTADSASRPESPGSSNP